MSGKGGRNGCCLGRIIFALLLVVGIAWVVKEASGWINGKPPQDSKTTQYSATLPPQKASEQTSAPIQTVAPTDEPVKHPTIIIGDRSDDVLQIKQRLYELGYYKTTSLTKDFTKNASDIIKKFQSANGLPQTGEIDHETRVMIFSDSALGPKGAKQATKAAATPRPTKTPRPTPTQTPSNLGVQITSMSVGKNMIGQNEAEITVKNYTSKAVDSFSYAIQCVDIYGVLLSQYDWGLDYSIHFEASHTTIKPGRTAKSGVATLHGFDRAKQYSVAITKYHFTDGDYVIIPRDEWVWTNYK